ncbi:MAG TPA: hypothetical protein VM555_02315 [Tahibacter sp.]|jgi:hypothetical protein|nr:hypothetical protein [Tahibacter sp.]
MKPTRLEAAYALLAAAWAAVSFAKAVIKHLIAPTPRRADAVNDARTRLTIRVRKSNNLQRWSRR